MISLNRRSTCTNRVTPGHVQDLAMPSKTWLSCIYAAFRHLLLVKCRIDALEKYFLRA